MSLEPTLDDKLSDLPILSVVVPTRNEADNIKALVGRLKAALAEVAFELIFVDDSDDDTPRVVESLAATDPRIHCIHRARPERAGGLGTAVTHGFALAQAGLICVMDGDLQHPPETVRELLAAEQLTGADLVVASRYMPGGSQDGLDGGYRLLISRGSSLLAKALFSKARVVSDPMSGFFLFRRSLIDGVELHPVGFKILLDILVRAKPASVVAVPLEFQERGSGTSKASTRQGLLYLRHLSGLLCDSAKGSRKVKFAGAVLGLMSVLAILRTGPARYNRRRRQRRGHRQLHGPGSRRC